jgi:hypothetical protein
METKITTNKIKNKFTTVGQVYANSDSLSLRVEVYLQDGKTKVCIYLNGVSRDISIEELTKIVKDER